jgi:hypothetical protein
MPSPLPFSLPAISQRIVRALAYRLALTAEALEQQIAEFFPLEARKWGIGLYLYDPRVKLDEIGNRIHLHTQLEVILPGQLKARGYLEMAGTLVYVPAEGAFYIDRPEICDFSLLSIPSRYLTPVRVMVRSVLSRFVVNLPVYKFRDNSLRHRLARAVVRTVEIDKGKLRVRFATILRAGKGG